MKRSTVLVLCLVTCLAACKDEHSLSPDASTSGAPDAEALPPGPRVAVVSGEYGGAGLLSDLDVAKLAVRENISPAGGVGSDPLIRRFDDKVYVINRSGADNISVYDAATLHFVEQYGTGLYSNPQDVALVGGTMYVVGGPGIVKVGVGSGTITGSIDLAAAIGDPDGNPDCVSIEKVDSKLYVACDYLMYLASYPYVAYRGNGKVAVIDTANSDAVSVVTLPDINPLNYFVHTPATSVFGGDLLIGLTTSYTDYSTGCIARVSTGSSPMASCAAGLTNMQIGGILTHMDISADGTMLWMAVNSNNADFSVTSGTLRGFDLTAGTLWEQAVTPTTQLITDVAPCPDGELVVADRTMDASGLRVYGTDLKERTTAALEIGLPPLFGNNTICYDPSAL